MRKLRDARGDVDKNVLEEELARAVAAAGDAQSDAEYRLQTLLREAAAVLDRDGGSPDVAVARRALARSKRSLGASRQALELYRFVVAGITRHGVQLDSSDLAFLFVQKDWQTLLAALSRSPRQNPIGVEHAVLTFAALRGRGRDPLAGAMEVGDSLPLTTDAATAVNLLAAIDALARGGIDAWPEDLPEHGAHGQAWRTVVAGLLDAFAHDDHTLLISTIRHAAELSREAPPPVADLALALCAWAALSADPLADDPALGAAMTPFPAQTRESAAIIAMFMSSYRLTSDQHSPEFLPEGNAASVVALNEISSLVAARAHLLSGERKHATDELRAETAGDPFLPMALRRVLAAHARVGDLQARSPEGLVEALQQSVSLSGVSASITVTIREALVLLLLRKGNVGEAAAELVAWGATAPQASPREARHVLARTLVTLGGQVPVLPYDPLPAVSLLGWRAQARLSAQVVSDSSEVEPLTPDPLDPESAKLGSGAIDLAEKLGEAHPIIVAQAIAGLERDTSDRSANFAARIGQLADWMLAHGYNAYLCVFSLRVTQGEQLLKLGHTQHAVRVLTYATNRLDDLLPQRRELRADAMLLRAQAEIAARDCEQALQTVAALDPVTSGQRATAAYFEAVARQGLGDLLGASAAIKDSFVDEILSARRFGVTPDAVQRRVEMIEARMAASLMEQSA